MKNYKIFYYITVNGKFVELSHLGQEKEDFINNNCIELLKIIDENKCYYHPKGGRVLSVFYEKDILNFRILVCCNSYATELLEKVYSFEFSVEITHLRPDAQSE